MADAGAHDVGEWLASIGMQKYAPLFSAAKVETLAQVYELNETSLRELGVTVPGHVRRIILAQTELEKKLEHLALQGDDDDYDDEATDVLRTPQFRGPSLGIASAAPSVKAAAAAAATAAAATPGAALATAASKTHKAKFNSTSSLYIYSTIMKPDIQEIVFCVAIVLLDRISEGEEALALRRAEAAEAASGGGGDDGGAGASDGSEVPEFFRSPLGVPSRRLDVLRERGGGDGAPAGSETAGADGADGAGGAGAGGDGGAAATGEGEGEGELTEAAIFRAVKTIHERAELSSEVLVIALLFIERLRQLASLPLLLCNWQPVLVTALLVAQKVWDDASLLNLDFATVVSPYTVAELNAMEKRFLTLIEYNVSISAKTYAAYYFELRTLCEKEERAFTLKPLSKAEASRLQSKTAAMEEGLKSAGVRREWASSAATYSGHSSSQPRSQLSGSG